MAGHSQFKNIMHRKGRQDAMRSRLFSKLSREITVAAKSGLPDPAMNPRLRLAVAAAKAQSMSKEVIERAIKKAQGSEAEQYDEIRYEGYAPGGVAIIVEAMTDNRNRTAADVRSAFTKAGGNLAESGAVAFMFTRLGEVAYPVGVATSDAMLEAAIEAGADDCESDGENHLVTCTMAALAEVAAALEARFGPAPHSRLVWRPQNRVPVDDETGERIIKLIDQLDDHDDVQSVTTNAEFSEALLSALRST